MRRRLIRRGLPRPASVLMQDEYVARALGSGGGEAFGGEVRLGERGSQIRCDL